MALTRNGKFTGRAAVIAKLELKQELIETADRAVEKIKLDFGETLNELRCLDPSGWSDWYDANVPDWNDWMKCKPAMDVIQKRIAELKSV